MLHHFSTPRRKCLASSIAAYCVIATCATGQNFTMEVANSDPLGIGNFVPTFEDLNTGTGSGVKGDFDYGVGLTALYNSNLFLTETNEDGDVSGFLTPWLRYNSDPEGGARYTLTANYTPVIRTYADHSELNGIDQSADFLFEAEGSRTNISIFGRYNELSGTDRLTGDFVEGALLTGGIRANRQIAPRTWLNAGWTAAISDYGSSSNEGAEVFTTYFGGLWDVSERLSVGPTLRYTTSDSDNIGSADAWAVLLETRYKAGERLWLSTSIGPEYTMASGGGSDEDSIGVTGNLNAQYIINARWAWETTIRSATVPAPSEANALVNDITLTTSLQRQLNRGWMSGGLEYSFSQYRDVGTGSARSDEQTLGVFFSYHRFLFSERVILDSLIRYSVNDGDVDWSQLMVSTGVNVLF